MFFLDLQDTLAVNGIGSRLGEAEDERNNNEKVGKGRNGAKMKGNSHLIREKNTQAHISITAFKHYPLWFSSLYSMFLISVLFFFKLPTIQITF